MLRQLLHEHSLKHNGIKPVSVYKEHGSHLKLYNGRGMHLPLPLALKQDLGSSPYSKGLLIYIPGLIQFSSVSQSCLTLWNSTDCSTPGFPVHHHLLEIAQTHVHRLGDVIQPSYPLSSPSPPAFNLSQHQGLFQGVSSSFFFSFVFISWRLITLQYCSGFCRTLT